MPNIPNSAWSCKIHTIGKLTYYIAYFIYSKLYVRLWLAKEQNLWVNEVFTTAHKSGFKNTFSYFQSGMIVYQYNYDEFCLGMCWFFFNFYQRQTVTVSFHIALSALPRMCWIESTMVSVNSETVIHMETKKRSRHFRSSANCVCSLKDRPWRPPYSL